MKTLALIILAPFCIGVYLLLLLAPPALMSWCLVSFIGCDPGLAILLGMAVAAIWSFALPSIIDP